MIIQHIYTVVRTFEIKASQLEDKKEFFEGAITDEPGEYLYGGSCGDETITVKMVVERKRGKSNQTHS